MSSLLAERGECSESAETLQRKLVSLGVYDGPCDRCYNEELHAPVNKFQLANKLTPSEVGCDQATFDEISNQAGFTFHEAFQAELASMPACGSRAGVDLPEAGRADFNSRVIRNAHKRPLAGLAFSGGGIRSATFNLGILEALAQTRMLHKFDYLSTVSGGGFIGSWLSRWIAVHPNGVLGVEDEIAQRGDGPTANPNRARSGFFASTATS
jgi:hypothetical protein